MTQTTSPEQWLSRYASNYHSWKLELLNGKKVYKRRLGLVESSFDLDGAYFGGRADLHALLTLELRHTLPSKDAFRRRITLAWANLRLQHVLLMSRVHDDEPGKRNFVIALPESKEEVLHEAEKHIAWIEDFYAEVDGAELNNHSMNVARVLNATECLSKIHVLPLVKLPNGNFELRFLFVMAHQISDGLSAFNWWSHFLRILNTPEPELLSQIDFFKSEENIASRLPPAQEDLYPPVSGNKARERWFWAIMRVLRHVKKSLPPAFTNPLWRETRRQEAVTPPPKFSHLFDYSSQNRPPMNSGRVHATLSRSASVRLISLCKQSKVSVGAGCFALAGVSMMELHEERHPDVPLSARAAFASGFPLNPRAFFGYNTPADSCMLAFSSGIVMPFLSSDLPIEGRLRLTAKHANRELKMYQKRLKPTGVNISLDSHSPGRLLANGYLVQIERNESRLPNSLQTGVNPQGDLPASMSKYGATCGVSSLGSTAAFLKAGMYDLDNVGGMNGKDLVVDYRNLSNGVRARDGEFLIGSSTNGEGIVEFGVSYDGNAIPEEAAEIWARKIEGLLERGEARL